MSSPRTSRALDPAAVLRSTVWRHPVEVLHRVIRIIAGLPHRRKDRVGDEIAEIFHATPVRIIAGHRLDDEIEVRSDEQELPAGAACRVDPELAVLVGI